MQPSLEPEAGQVHVQPHSLYVVSPALQTASKANLPAEMKGAHNDSGLLLIDLGQQAVAGQRTATCHGIHEGSPAQILGPLQRPAGSRHLFGQRTFEIDSQDSVQRHPHSLQAL